MVGAKINGKIVPIDHKLKNGEICEIITQKEEHPNRAWIDICKTASAKSKIRSWFKHEKRDENIVEGKQMVDREFKRQGMNLNDEEMAEFFNNVSMKKQYNTLDDFFAAVGYGGIQLWKIMPRLKEEYQKTYAKDIETIGYITRGYGVSIHKRGCTNVPKNIAESEEPERWVSAHWEIEAGEAFRSTLQIIAADRTGLLADVTIQLSNMHIFIHTLNSRELKTGKAVVTITIDVAGRDHLRGVISRLSDINGIEEIKRL